MVSTRRGVIVVTSAVAVVALYAALQYWWLPPEGFLSGDQGAKFLQARAALQHGPFHPWIEGPSLDVDTELRWQEPFLMRHSGHLVGVFPWLFAALTAPFLGLFGLRGLYVLPALSVALLFVASCRIGRGLGQPAQGVWSGWCAVLATPVLFYGAELWEHAPAVALTTAAAALMLPGAARGRWQYPAAAASLVVATTLRPEALLMMPALVIARIWVSGRNGLVRDLAALAGGGLLTGALVAAGNYVVYGMIVPHQVSSNLAVALPYLAVRSDVMMMLVLPVWHRKVFVFALSLIALGALSRSQLTRVRATHAGVALILVVGLAVPLWRTHVGGLRWLATFGAQHIAHTWPFVFVPAYWVALRRDNPRERFLFAAAGLFMLLVFATMPHTGGAQWGARFFLAAAPLAAALAVQIVVRPENASGCRAVPWTVRGMAAAGIAASIGVQLSGLAYLHHFKRVNAGLTQATSQLTKPGDVIVSDVFWFPEVTATLYPTRRLLFAWSPADFAPIAARSQEVGATGFWIAASSVLTGYLPPPEFAGTESGATWVLKGRHQLPASSVTLHEYRLADQ